MSPRAGNPVTAVTGIVGYVTRRTLALTGRVALTGISTGLSLLEGSRRAQQTTKRYAGTAVQLASTTPLAKLMPVDRIDDGADDEAERIISAVSNGGPARQPAAAPAKPAEAPAKKAAAPAAPKPAAAVTKPAPAAASKEAREVGAPGAASAQAQAAVDEAVTADSLPTEPTRADLPIADYDSVSLPSLRARLRSLSLDDLAVLREYEQAHAHRLPVVTMLDNRIAKVAAESAATDAASEAAPAGDGALETDGSAS